MVRSRPPVLLPIITVLLLLLSACGSAPSGRTDSSGAEGGAPAAVNSKAAQREAPAAAAPDRQAPAQPAAKPGAAADSAKAGGAPSAPEAAPAQGAGGNVLPLDQRIIRTGRIDLIVADVSTALRAVTDIARGAGGYIQQSSTKDQANVTIAELVLRVPVEQYDGVFQQLRDLAVPDKKPSEDSTSQDVTEEFADIDARIRNLKATEEQLLRLLARAERMEDILIVQRELTSVREQIERLQGRLNVLERQTAYSTISVTLRPPVEAKRPAPPALTSPAQAAAGLDTRPLFRWSTSEGATAYALQVTSEIDTSFANPLLSVDNLMTTSYEWPAAHEELRSGTVYRWRVRGANATGDGEWSPARTFTTVPAWNPIHTISDAWEASLKFLQGVVDVMLAAVVFFWWLIPLLVLLSLLLRNRRRRPRRPSPAAPASGPAVSPPPADASPADAPPVA